MPVTSTANKVSYTADGIVSEYPFYLPISSLSDIKVQVIDLSGNVSLLTVDNDYYVESSDLGVGGNVVTIANGGGGSYGVPFPAGYTILISRSPDRGQSTDWVDGDALSAASIENAVDKLTMQVQELYDISGRCLKVPIVDNDIGDLPMESLRPGKYLYCNESGEFTLVEEVDVGSMTISAFAETFLDDANASEARTTLGDYDLIIDSEADFDLLVSGGPYKRVLVKNGTYTVDNNLDLSTCGVILFVGEGSVNLAFTTTSGTKILLGSTTRMSSFTISTDDTRSTTEAVVACLTTTNTAVVEHVVLSSSAASPITGFANISGGLYDCRATGFYKGFQSCTNLHLCYAENCVQHFDTCYYLAQCLSLATGSRTTYHFTSCEYLIECKAYRASVANTDIGYYLCNYMSLCIAYKCGGNGFSNCTRMTACLAQANGGSGYVTCTFLSVCSGYQNVSHGFSNGQYMTGCYANSNTGSGFSGCSDMMGCDSYSNTSADTVGQEPIKEKMLSFTAWNMDTPVTTKAVAHYLSLADIRSVSGVLFNNAGTAAYNIPTASTDSSYFEVMIESIDSTNINLKMRTGGLFDAAAFNAAYGYLIVKSIATGI